MSKEYLCNVCGKKTATVHFTQIIDGKKDTIHMCEDCAAKQSIVNPKKTKLAIDLAQSLKSQLELKKSKKISNKICPTCKRTIEQFQNTSKFSCPDCYEAFSKITNKILLDIHLSDTHIGKKLPSQDLLKNPKSSDISMLKQKQKKAIEEENYELAAKLRDLIKQIS